MGKKNPFYRLFSSSFSMNFLLLSFFLCSFFCIQPSARAFFICPSSFIETQVKNQRSSTRTSVSVKSRIWRLEEKSSIIRSWSLSTLSEEEEGKEWDKLIEEKNSIVSSSQNKQKLQLQQKKE